MIDYYYLSSIDSHSISNLSSIDFRSISVIDQSHHQKTLIGFFCYIYDYRFIFIYYIKKIRKVCKGFTGTFQNNNNNIYIIYLYISRIILTPKVKMYLKNEFTFLIS